MISIGLVVVDFHPGKLLYPWWFILLVMLISAQTQAAKYAIQSDVSTRVEYNDNIFITSQPHDGVYGMTVIPQARIEMQEQNWNTHVNAKLRSNNYSDHSLDSNDVYLDLVGKYQQERNIYTLKGQYDKDSNLNQPASDFGVTATRVNRRIWSVSPEYTRLLSERSLFSVSYSHTDVEYEDIPNTGFVPYELDTLSGSFSYSLTSRDDISFSMQAVDYKAKDDTVEYQLFVTRFGVEHQFSSIWSADFSIGGSRRDSTNRITQTFDFFGQPITQTQELDFSDKGYVLDAGVERKHETGKTSARISRDDVTNSQGGLNEVNTFRFQFYDRLTERWRYSVNARYENIDAVSSVQRTTDREIVSLEPVITYEIDRNLSANFSYRYIQRIFKNNLNDRAPHSNRIYIGITYNIPEVSTF